MLGATEQTLQSRRSRGITPRLMRESSVFRLFPTLALSLPSPSSVASRHLPPLGEGLASRHLPTRCVIRGGMRAWLPTRARPWLDRRAAQVFHRSNRDAAVLPRPCCFSIPYNTDPPPIWRGSCRCIPKSPDSPSPFGSRVCSRSAAKEANPPNAFGTIALSVISKRAPHHTA